MEIEKSTNNIETMKIDTQCMQICEHETCNMDTKFSELHLNLSKRQLKKVKKKEKWLKRKVELRFLFLSSLIN